MRNTAHFTYGFLKRVLAMLLAFLIFIPCVAVIGVGNILLSGNAEAESSTVVYNAIKEFNSGETQSGVWRYQVTYDIENPDWFDLNTSVSGSGYWYDNTYRSDAFRMYRSGNMRIWNKGECLSKLNRPALCWGFIAPRDGEIEIPETSIIYREGDITANARVTLNGVQVYPESGWLSVSAGNSVTCSEIALSLAEGDIVRFEIAPSEKLQTAALGVRWNPSFYFIDNSKNYVETDGVLNGLSAFMYDYFSSLEGSELISKHENSLQSALAQVGRSKYGTYSVADTFYTGGILESSDTSVWKFGVKNKNDDIFIHLIDKSFVPKVSLSGGSVCISWDVKSASDIYSLRVKYPDKAVTEYTVATDSIVLPKENTEFCFQVYSEECASQIMSVKIIGDNVECSINENDYITYLCESEILNKGKSYQSVILSDESVQSEYEVFVSYKNLESGTTIPQKRRVTYRANSDEQMMLGFTAPFSGEYELSVPFSCDSPERIEYYGILKESSSGEYTELESDERKEKICHLQTELLAGDTVWICISVTDYTTIDVGIPTLRYFEDISSNEVDYRRYRAVDYFESSYANGRDYNIYSLTDSKAGSWSFGYFINPIDDEGENVNYDTLGYGSYAVGDDVSSLVDSFVPYELIRNGVYYNALPAVITSDNSIMTANGLGVLGVMYPCLELGWNNRSKTGVPYLCKGIYSTFGTGTTRSGELCNMGVYLRFTAPKSGNAVLNLNDDANLTAGDRMMVLKNQSVIALYSGIVGSGKTVDLGFLKEGDTVEICYGMTNSSKTSAYIGMPVITISSNNVSVNLKDYSGISQLRTTAGGSITLPYCEDIPSRRFVGWSSSDLNIYLPPETETSVEDIDEFKAVYQYYGDINNDGRVDSFDLLLMRKVLLEASISGEPRNADVVINGRVNIIDLIRIKKWLAGIPVALGEKQD